MLFYKPLFACMSFFSFERKESVKEYGFKKTFSDLVKSVDSRPSG